MEMSDSIQQENITDQFMPESSQIMGDQVVELLDIPAIIYEDTLKDRYLNQRSLVMICQVFLVALLLIKFFLPKYMRNTQQKLVAFLFILNSMHMYKRLSNEFSLANGEIFYYYLILLSSVSSFMHAFKFSSFSRSTENAVIQKVMQNEENHQNAERLYNLHEDPLDQSLMHYLFNMLTQSLTITLSIVQLLAYEEQITTQDFMSSTNYIIPQGTVFFNLFLLSHLSQCEYIGRNSCDYWQYLMMRTFPVMAIFVQIFLIDGCLVHFTVMYNNAFISSFIGIAVATHIIILILYDWNKSTKNTFEETIENQYSPTKSKNLKKVVLENSQRRFKMIIYREEMDGGIQGIMLDFYVNENGEIANEFYKIDSNGDLIQIENGIKPIEDKQKSEQLFKKFFLKY